MTKPNTLGLVAETLRKDYDSKGGGHLYYLGEQGPFPGATSITKVHDAASGGEGLVNWAANITLSTALDVVAAGGDIDRARAAAWAAKNAARDTGTAVHKGVEAVNLSQRVEVTPEHAMFLAQYAGFLVKHGVQVVAAEQVVVNTTHRYGGSFDLLGYVDGKLALVDVKTGKPWPTHRLQLAGYEMAEWTGHEGTVPERMPKVDTCYVLLLRPDTFELIEYEITDEDREHFADLVKTYHRAHTWRNAA